MPVDLDVVVEVDPDLLPCGQFIVGRRESGRSQRSKSSRRDFPYSLMTRSFSSTSFSAMAALSSSKEKNRLSRKGARTHLSTFWTATSALAFS